MKGVPTRVQRRVLGPGTSVSSIDRGLPDAMFLRSCLQGALPLRPDWSTMTQRPPPPPAVLRRPWEPMEALACCTGLGLAAQDSFLPRLISSTISRLPPPLSCAFKLRVLEAFALESRCKFHGLALAPASHLISPGSPAQQPLQPGYSPTPSPPHYIPGSFPPPHLCSSHCLGLEHHFHLSTY